MYVFLSSFVALILQLLPPVVPTSSPAPMIRGEGEDVVFMFNTSTNILSVSWGIRNGETNNFKLVLIAVNTISGVQSTNNAGYAGRVSFVGDLSKGHAWFKITSLNISDTHQYMAQIYSQGETPGQYNYAFVQLAVTKRAPISSPGSLTREPGEDVVFMYNGTAMSEATWGVQDGNTNDLNPRLYRAFNPGGAFPDTQINSTSYAGRVSFVGDLTQGQAWFKITNLNINDTNQYLVKIILLKESSYRPSAASLTVLPITTRPPQTTATTESTSATSSSPSFPRPTTLQTPQLSNQSISIKVVSDVCGDLSDPNSAAFGNFTQNFISEVNSVYRSIENFAKAKVTSLSENSIPVKFVVYFKSPTKPDEICAPIREAVNDNRLGSLNIVPGSLGCSKGRRLICELTYQRDQRKVDTLTFYRTKPRFSQKSIKCCLSVYLDHCSVRYCHHIADPCCCGPHYLYLEIKIINCRSIQAEKNLEAYENVHSMENTPEARTQPDRTPKDEKELYETINENRGKSTGAGKLALSPSIGTQIDAHSLPQHYQELQRKAPNQTQLYEPLKHGVVGNKGDPGSTGPSTYERLHQSPSGREYQSLSKLSKDTESKV